MERAPLFRVSQQMTGSRTGYLGRVYGVLQKVTVLTWDRAKKKPKAISGSEITPERANAFYLDRPTKDTNLVGDPTRLRQLPGTTGSNCKIHPLPVTPLTYLRRG